MSDPLDRLLNEFAEVTASARVPRPAHQPRRRPALATALAGALVVVVTVGIGFIVLNGPTLPPAPVARATASPALLSPALPSPVPAPTRRPDQTLYIENRGGPPLSVQIGGTAVATVECGAAPTLSPGQSGIPSLPWDLVIAKADDGTQLWSGRITALPGWLVQIGDQTLGFSNAPVSGPPGPPCPSESPTSERSPSPSATPAVLAGDLTRNGWAPDGQHLILLVHGGNRVVDLDGTTLLSFDAYESNWIDSSTIETFEGAGLGEAARFVNIYDISTGLIGTIPGRYVSAVFTPSLPFVALEDLPPNGQEEGTRYRIWDGSSLSGWHDGIPLDWSSDGSRLVVLHLTGAPGNGLDGTLSIVDGQGAEVATITGWTSNLKEPVALSPDGRYVAACLTDGSSASIKVYDTQTASISDVVDGCGFALQWTNEPALYLSDVVNPPITWTPGAGVAGTGFSADTRVSVAYNGDAASWTDLGPVVHLQVGDTTVDREVPGNVEDVTWSPDGRAIAVLLDDGLTIIRVMP